MARDCTNTQSISGAFTGLNGATKATMTCWIRRDSSGTFQQIGPSDLTSSNKLLIDWYSDNILYFEVGNGSNVYGQVSANFGGWNHLAMVYDGTQATNDAKLVCYLNGAQQTLSFSGSLPTSLPASGLTMYVNKSNWATGTGGYAECGIWDTNLTPEEIAILNKSFSPDQVRPSSLVLYMPMINDVHDIVGTVMTNTGTTASPHIRYVH